jgi:very-short-patch-repair endonuclease
MSGCPSESNVARSKLVEKLRDNLLDISGRNKAVRLSQKTESRHFDFSILDQIRTDFSKTTIDQLLNGKVQRFTKLSTDDGTAYRLALRNLEKVKKSSDEMLRERGSAELYIAGPFIEGYFKGTNSAVRGPLLLIPAELSLTGSSKAVASYELRAIGPAEINLALISAWSRAADRKIIEEKLQVDESWPNLLSYLEGAKKLLENVGLEFTADDAGNACSLADLKAEDLIKLPDPPLLRPAFLLANINSNRVQPIIKDLQELMGQDGSLGLLDRFLEPDLAHPLDEELILNVDRFPSFEEKKDSECFYVLPTDSSQEKIISDLRDKKSEISVIWGPPGTGKSQTICNLLANAMEMKLSVLLVSQKRAALDVVAKRMASPEVGLGANIALIHDPKGDKATFIHQLNSVLNSIRNGVSEDQQQHFFPEIDATVERLKAVSAAMLDRSFGNRRLFKIYEEAAVLEAVTSPHPNAPHLESYDGILKLRRELASSPNLPAWSPCEEYRLSWANLKDADLEAAKAAVAAFLEDTRFWSGPVGLLQRLSQGKYIKEAFARLAKGLKNVISIQCLDGMNESKLKVFLVDLQKTIIENSAALRAYDLQLSNRPDLTQIIQGLRRAGLAKEDWGNSIALENLKLWIAAAEQKHSALVYLDHAISIEEWRTDLSKHVRSKGAKVARHIKQEWVRRNNNLKTRAALEGLKDRLTRKNKPAALREGLEGLWDDSGFRSAFPIWLTSPEASSALFPLRKGLFDLVIFDEASQCLLEEAAPSIYRGMRCIIAGDHKQLPPGDALASDDGGSSISEDDESLMMLGRSLARRRPQQVSFHQLLWHYRSKYEQLIQFSNHGWYNRSLIISPSAIPYDSVANAPIKWISVPGIWVENRNEIEANAVVDHLKKVLLEDTPPSVGIVTFNRPQKDLIEELIAKRKSEDPEFEEAMRENSARPLHEQLFVKNLENVQGDEREFILFSVAYAKPPEGGSVRANFGSLNQNGGDRRLNVAVSRASRGVRIFCSFDPQADLDLSNSKSSGAGFLKDYLIYAKAVASGENERAMAQLALVSRTPVGEAPRLTETDSVFEDQVLSALKQEGLTLHTQVGQSGFYIDMAVIDPRAPSRYILGIECDGAAFHSGLSVRERDLYRQRILEDRGWKIHRIWSRNWWKNSQKEVAKIVELLNKIIAEEASVTEGAIPQAEFDEKTTMNDGPTSLGLRNAAPISEKRVGPVKIQTPAGSTVISLQKELVDFGMEAVPLAGPSSSFALIERRKFPTLSETVEQIQLLGFTTEYAPEGNAATDNRPAYIISGKPESQESPALPLQTERVLPAGSEDPILRGKPVTVGSQTWHEKSKSGLGLALAAYQKFECRGAPDPKEASTKQISDFFEKVVTTEGPISASLLYRRYLQSCGAERLSRATQKKFNVALGAGKRRRLFFVSEEASASLYKDRVFVYADQHFNPGAPRTLGDRSLQDVPRRELAALFTCVSSQLLIQHKDALFRSALEGLGLTRITAGSRAALDEAYEFYTHKAAERQGGLIVSPAEARLLARQITLTPEVCESILQWNEITRLMTNSYESTWISSLRVVEYNLRNGKTSSTSDLKSAVFGLARAIELGWKQNVDYVGSEG